MLLDGSSSHLAARGVGHTESTKIAGYDQKIKDLHIANLVCGLLLGAASASIAVTGAASAFPFVVVISAGGLYYSQCKVMELVKRDSFVNLVSPNQKRFLVIARGALPLLSAATSIAVGSSAILPFAVAAISAAGLYCSLSKTHKVAEERMRCIQNEQNASLSEDGSQLTGEVVLESSKGTAGKNELIKGMSYAFAGFVSGFAVTLLLGHFMAAKPAAVVEPEVRIQPYPYPNPYSI